jgi:hypothetical protein
VDRITISDFEKITNIPNQTISRAISEGKIPIEFVTKTGPRRPVFLSPHESAIAWLKNLHGTTQLTHALRTKLEAYINTFDTALPLRTESGLTKNEGSETPSAKNDSYAESQRREKLWKARLAEIEFKEKEGSLVDKSEVYSQLFTFGKEIRIELESIPTRTAPKILICQGDITKITEVLAIEIQNSLKKLIENLSEKKLTS